MYSCFLSAHLITWMEREKSIFWSSRFSSLCLLLRCSKASITEQENPGWTKRSIFLWYLPLGGFIQCTLSASSCFRRTLRKLLRRPQWKGSILGGSPPYQPLHSRPFFVLIYRHMRKYLKKFWKPLMVSAFSFNLNLLFKSNSLSEFINRKKMSLMLNI